VILSYGIDTKSNLTTKITKVSEIFFLNFVLFVSFVVKTVFASLLVALPRLVN